MFFCSLMVILAEKIDLYGNSDIRGDICSPLSLPVPLIQGMFIEVYWIPGTVLRKVGKFRAFAVS